jgi:hypothetical protein
LRCPIWTQDKYDYLSAIANDGLCNPTYKVDLNIESLMDFEKIKDEVKKKMCLESDIDLYQIDTTEQDNFNESSSTKYLYFIIDKIEEKLNQNQLNFLYKFDS